MNYTKFTDEEILEVYETMIAYSGKAESDVLTEIERRGGLSNLQKACKDRQVIPNEIKRIESIVFTMLKNQFTPEEIRKNITSEILGNKELDDAIENAINSSQKYLNDISVGPRTIIMAILGVTVSCIAGLFIWKYSIAETKGIDYSTTEVVIFVSLIIIGLFTRKSKNNIVVMIAIVLAAAISLVLGICLK
jgi:hypothetical protein